MTTRTFTRCCNCAAWDRFTKLDVDGAGQGRCRRFAPRPAMFGLFTDGEGRYGEVSSEWPHTREDDGCCEAL